MKRWPLLLSLLVTPFAFSACDISIDGDDDDDGAESEQGTQGGDDDGDDDDDDDADSDGDDGDDGDVGDDSDGNGDDGSDGNDDDGNDGNDDDGNDGNDSVGDDGGMDETSGDDGALTCEDAGGCQACFDCETGVGGSCEPETLACGENPECVDIAACYEDCNANLDREDFDTCWAICTEVYPTGVEPFVEFVNCGALACDAVCE